MSEKQPCRRTGTGLLPFVTASATLAFYTLQCRPRLLTWGATQDETARAYPGDELVPDPDGSSTMATDLPAPPEQVWPWLAQMGYDRGGWYSWDWLDRYGHPSADHVAPEWRKLEEGQRLKASRDGRFWFTVALLEPNRTLVLRSDLNLSGGRSFDPRTKPLPQARLDGIWAFHLRPAPFGETRLVVRTRGQGHPRWLTRPFDLVFGEPAHFIMQTRQFRNLRARVGAEGMTP